MVLSSNLCSLANHLVAYSATWTSAQKSTNPDQQNSMIAFPVSSRGRGANNFAAPCMLEQIITTAKAITDQSR
jgi:hypothetical protein